MRQGLQQINRVECPSGIMSTMKEAENVVVEALYSHADTVDRRVLQSIKPGRSDIIWIHFDGHLCALRQRKVFLDTLEDLKQHLRRQLAGCSSTYI